MLVKLTPGVLHGCLVDPEVREDHDREGRIERDGRWKYLRLIYQNILCVAKCFKKLDSFTKIIICKTVQILRTVARKKVIG